MNQEAKETIFIDDLKQAEEKNKQEKTIEEHLMNALIESQNYARLAEKFVANYGVYYDEKKIWWWWNETDYCWEMVDEVDIMNAVDKATLNEPATVKLNIKNQIIEALKRKSRLNKPVQPKKTWIQFKDKIIDIEETELEKAVFPATKKYFFVNPIPHSLCFEDLNTPNTDQIFSEWIEDEKDKETLYEIIAYCIMPEYFLKEVFCLIGSGDNGKSKYLKIVRKVIGEKNRCTSDFEILINNRFESSKLFNKLVCFMGETNFNVIKNTSTFKRLTGDDDIRGEFKGKDSFDFTNYAKIIIATNTLPKTQDRTKGYYSRWNTIDFKKQFSGEQDVLARIPEEEYSKLATKCLMKLKALWKKRKFSNHKTPEEKERQYEEKSNPLVQFIKKEFIEDPLGEIPFFKFYDRFNHYLSENGFRKQAKQEVLTQLREENYEDKRNNIELFNEEGEKTRTKWRFIYGIKAKEGLERWYEYEP